MYSVPLFPRSVIIYGNLLFCFYCLLLLVFFFFLFPFSQLYCPNVNLVMINGPQCIIFLWSPEVVGSIPAFLSAEFAFCSNVISPMIDLLQF